MAQFPTTTWGDVERLRESSEEEARAALARLCEVYWQPLYVYLRQKRHGRDQAMDLVQSYFVHLIASDALAQAEPHKGRFRSFLIVSLKNFIANERRHEGAMKRAPAGGLESLDARVAERRFLEMARDELDPEVLFERNWAVTLIERGVGRLRDEETERGRQGAFEALAPHVLGAGPRPSYRSLADGLELSEGTVKVRVSRLRKRLGRLLCQEVRATVAEEADVEAELRHLLALWGAARA